VTFHTIEIIRRLWGAMCLMAPRKVLYRVDRVEADRAAVVVVRVLGARHIVQAAFSGVDPSPEVLAAGAWVDTVHSVTALGLAVLDRYRVALRVSDALVAALWAMFGLRDLRRSRNHPAAGHDRRRDRLARTLLPWLPGGRRFLARADRVRHSG
jgi:hypothetical protein